MIIEELEAKNERFITASGLLEEIKPLLDDYFVGEISFGCGGLIYCLPNGQKFIIKVQAA